MPTPEERIIAAAAAMLGRKGGLAKSAKKANAGRENGKKGGRPRLQNPNAAQLKRIARDRVAAGVCRHCGGAVPCPSEFGDVRVGVRRKAQ